MSVTDHEDEALQLRLAYEFADHCSEVTVEEFMDILRDDGSRIGHEIQDMPNILEDADAKELNTFSKTDFTAPESKLYPAFVSNVRFTIAS